MSVYTRINPIVPTTNSKKAKKLINPKIKNLGILRRKYALAVIAHKVASRVFES